MRFGERGRKLRNKKKLTLRELAPQVEVRYTYLSRVETGKLTYGDYPSRELIGKLAKVLGTDVDELLFLAGKIPEKIKRRVLERPEAFRRFADLNDATMDRLLAQLDT